MQTPVQRVIDTVSTWTGVESASHRFGGVEFMLGRVEIGHIHRGGMVDIPFTRALRAALVAAGEAEHHHLLHDSGWITYHMHGDAGYAQALRLYRLSYLHKRARRHIIADLPAQLDDLAFGAAINTIVQRGAKTD